MNSVINHFVNCYSKPTSFPCDLNENYEKINPHELKLTLVYNKSAIIKINHYIHMNYKLEIT